MTDAILSARVAGLSRRRGSILYEEVGQNDE
jgi:hypothetical protein